MSHYSTLKGLGRAVAYYPAIGIALGNPLAGIMLSQLIYWSNKTDNKLGVYKTAGEWTAETGLTYSQQRTARKLLCSLGILVETEKRLEHKIFYKLDIAVFDDWYQTNVIKAEISEIQIANSRNEDLAFGDKQNINSGSSDHQSVIHKITSEITTDINTQENSPKNSVDEVLNLWVPDLHSLNSWLQRSGEQPMTQDQVEQVLIEVNSYYSPRLKLGALTDTQMYSNFVKWIKRNKSTAKKPTRPENKKTQPANRNVNEAWANQPQYDGPVDHVDIPEDFY